MTTNPPTISSPRPLPRLAPPPSSSLPAPPSPSSYFATQSTGLNLMDDFKGVFGGGGKKARASTAGGTAGVGVGGTQQQQQRGREERKSTLPHSTRPLSPEANSPSASAPIHARFSSTSNFSASSPPSRPQPAPIMAHPLPQHPGQGQDPLSADPLRGQFRDYDADPDPAGFDSRRQSAYIPHQGQYVDDRASGGSGESSGSGTKVGSTAYGNGGLASPAVSYRKERGYNESEGDHYGGGYNGHGGHWQNNGSYSGSGLDSARASTIGTDHIHGGALPYNSSRVALNQEWRNSADIGDMHAVAPGKEGYGHASSLHGYSSAGDHGGPNATYVPIPPASPALGANEKRGLGEDGPQQPERRAPEPAVVLKRENRLAWIDGLRGLASIIIFTHHYSDLTWSKTYPNTLSYGSVYGFLRNGQLAVGMYFLLGGRVLAHSFQRSAYAVPKPVKDSHGALTGEMTKPTGPRWMSLSSSLFRRSIRLALPAIVIGFIQWIVCINGLVDTGMEANNKVLAPSALWKPTWCQIGDFGGFLRFSLDLFTERNHQYMLTVGSALWTTYDQFWGSVLVYITAALVAPVAWKGRYTIYMIMLVSLWYMNNSNFLYIAGLFLSDLHAQGFIRKVQDHWKPTMAIEISVMAVALAYIAGNKAVAAPTDRAFGKFTIYDGRNGWDPNQTWPQYMFASNWIPALGILIWIELSHAMQWFVSWRILVWLGKVSYGFYLLQFLTLYGLMPHLILAFAADGKSFWDNVIPTYIICLIFNLFLAWVAYHLLDRLGLHMGKWIWDGFFVNKPNNAAAMPAKFFKTVTAGIFLGPGRLLSHIGSGSVSKGRKWKKNIHTLFNWRTPTTRPAVPDPTDPDLLAQLHSTRWTFDLSHDKEAMRTYRLLRLQQYAWCVHLWLIPGLTTIWTYYHPTGKWTFDALTFSSIWRMFWVLSVPNCLAAYLGFITPDWAPTKATMDKKPVHREYIRNFFILLVTKGSNESAVRRGYNKLLPLEKVHPSVRVLVLTDEPYAYPDLQNVVCPKAYVSPLGKAKYKARALDYFRYHVSLGVYDWILHMDEESITDAETVRRCIEFIRYTPHHFGQGIILYNGEGYWENWLFTVADGIRVGDDLARFHFQNTVIKRPVFGVHGSFLMTNGEMENECTWDFGSLAEDFEFSQDAWRRGFTCGRIHGIVREQSPQSVRDFLKQRRRWFMGIRDIQGMYGLPHLAVNLWIVGVFTLAVTLINFPFTAFDQSLTPLWIAICANFCFATFYVIYLWGLLFQELDYGQPWWKIPMHLIPAIVIQPFASVLEGLSAIWAMSSEDFGKFEVIQKR